MSIPEWMLCFCSGFWCTIAVSRCAASSCHFSFATRFTSKNINKKRLLCIVFCSLTIKVLQLHDDPTAAFFRTRPPSIDFTFYSYAGRSVSHKSSPDTFSGSKLMSKVRQNIFWFQWPESPRGISSRGSN